MHLSKIDEEQLEEVIGGGLLDCCIAPRTSSSPPRASSLPVEITPEYQRAMTPTLVHSQSGTSLTHAQVMALMPGTMSRPSQSATPESFLRRVTSGR